MADNKFSFSPLCQGVFLWVGLSWHLFGQWCDFPVIAVTRHPQQHGVQSCGDVMESIDLCPPSMLNPTLICMNTEHLTASTWGTQRNHGKQHTGTQWIKLGTHKPAKKIQNDRKQTNTEPSHWDSPHAFTLGLQAGIHTDPPDTSRGIWTSWPTVNNITNDCNVFTSIHDVILTQTNLMTFP